MIEKINEQIGKLTLVATRDGQVMGVPHEASACPSGNGRRSGSSRASRSARSATRTTSAAHLIIDQSDIDLIHLGRRAWVKSLRPRRDRPT